MTLTLTQMGEKTGVVEAPTYIVTPTSTEVSHGSSSKGIQKKHVLILVGLIFLVGLIIAGILVGMHIFAEAQKDIVKFSLNFKSSGDGENVKQEVESDPNDNVVQYHIIKDGKDVHIVNDFNRDMQVVKMEYGFGVNCYISALNRSAAIDPSQITGPDQEVKSGNSTDEDSSVFSVSSSPISDRSFLPKKAQDMCKGISVYWAYRSCLSQTEPAGHDRQRRTVCITGCGVRVCSCAVRLIQWREFGRLRCRFYFGC